MRLDLRAVCSSLAVVLAVSSIIGCGGSRSGAPLVRPGIPVASGSQAIGAFVAHASPSKGTLTFEPMVGSAAVGEYTTDLTLVNCDAAGDPASPSLDSGRFQGYVKMTNGTGSDLYCTRAFVKSADITPGGVANASTGYSQAEILGGASGRCFWFDVNGNNANCPDTESVVGYWSFDNGAAADFSFNYYIWADTQACSGGGPTGVIAYASNPTPSNTAGDIWVMDADGSNQTKLTDVTPWHDYPAWSPDGTKIAFTTDRAGDWSTWEVYVMNADGSNQQILADQPTSNGFPSWSPDGAKIAFHKVHDGRVDIYVMDADGSNQQAITHSTSSDEDSWIAAWSPDGTKIAFERATNEIWVMDADGSNPLNLTNDPAFDQTAAWSPDSTQIAFARDREIWVMDADGSNQQSLGADGVLPTWSPDGNYIALCSERDGNYDIYVMDADGSNQHNITNNTSYNISPAWSP